MASDDRLQVLCNRYGIQTSYVDIWGHHHSVPRESLLAFLAAMDIVVHDDASIEDAIRSIDLQPWRRQMAPVQVVQQNEQSIPILLRLPECSLQSQVQWRLILENGEQTTGTVKTADLEVVEQGQVDGLAYHAFRFLLDVSLPLGYHRFEINTQDISDDQLLIVTPVACYLPERLAAGRPIWGASLQLYAVRSERNWGIGDFTDLSRSIDHFSELGAGILGLNPLHALFASDPEQASPYSPSNRLFLNTLYIDVEQIAEFAQCQAARQVVYSDGFQRDLQKLRQSELVDYQAVATAKRSVLESLYAYFREHHLKPGTERGNAFCRYQVERGEPFRRAALYEALQEHFQQQDVAIWGWPVWPEPYQDPDSSEVAFFLKAQIEKVEFFEYCRWQADLQFAHLTEQAQRASLALYCDLAVSANRAGSEVWSHRHVYAHAVSIGAPPDDFNLLGQNWGLPPYIPHRLFEVRYEPFVTLLRNNMPEQGALRIDHVMGLMRLFWIPEGQSAQNGAYVHYPFRDLMGILALESHRHRCLIVGEDLGTVPDEVRYALGPANVYSYRVLYFERDGNGDFKPPADYPEKAVATVGTHDLPTLHGYWQGRDISERLELNLFPSREQWEQQVAERAQDRLRIVSAIQREGFFSADNSLVPESCEKMTEELAEAIVKYIASSRALVAILQFEDMFGELDQVNLPGTTDERPNWRRKLSLSLEELTNHDHARRICAALHMRRRG